MLSEIILHAESRVGDKPVHCSVIIVVRGMFLLDTLYSAVFDTLYSTMLQILQRE